LLRREDLKAMQGTATILVHGGAGSWAGNRDDALAACIRAAEAGHDVLRRDGSAVDAVLAAVVVLEDDPSCNAGTGAVVTSDGWRELDACVMDGRTRSSGAVGALRGFKNPILIAEDVRKDGRYHLLVAAGASDFARAGGWRSDADESAARPSSHPSDERGNTVGAVALDVVGRLASAASTGGMAGQPPGRIGDTPIVGAGTYADDRAACSCTGAGESFARACTAFWAVDRSSGGVEKAAETALARTLQEFGGGGGLILLSHDGTYAVRKTVAAMPWAYVSLGGEPAYGI
jgi:L-asparaginase / beta-aspartyl-peptidase